MGVICVNSSNIVFSDDDFDQLQESEDDDDECVEEGQQPKAHRLLREPILYAIRLSFKRKQLERPVKKLEDVPCCQTNWEKGFYETSESNKIT